MVSGKCCRGVSPNTICKTWFTSQNSVQIVVSGGCCESVSRHGLLDTVKEHIVNLSLQMFRKRVGEQRGLAPGKPSFARDAGLFTAPWFLCPPFRRRGDIFWETFLLCFGPC